MASNQYDDAKHDDYIVCPRETCGARNAPKESEEFRTSCWNCGASLPHEKDISVGDEVELEVFDLHESGAGVGRLESGFIVLVHGAMPDNYYRVRIKRVLENHAEGELLEEIEPPSEETEETESEGDSGEDEEEDEAPGLGSRENYWGG